MPQGAREEFNRGNGPVAHADMIPFPVRDCFGESHSIVHPQQRGARLGEEDPARFSETYGLCAALEERETHFVFQVPDLTAQRRLRNV